MKILVVDDDDLLVEQLTADLLAQNYVVDTTSDGLLGWEYATATPYDLIVLDINLPGLDGVSLCQRLRQGGYAGAILLLTGRSSSDDKASNSSVARSDFAGKFGPLRQAMPGPEAHHSATVCAASHSVSRTKTRSVLALCRQSMRLDWSPAT